MIVFFLYHFRREKGEVQGNAESDYDSEEENEDGDLTVYECPGLAPVSINSAWDLNFWSGRRWKWPRCLGVG